MNGANGEAMEVVKDEEDGNEKEVDEKPETTNGVRSPVKLRGRGGFTHSRGSRGSGRGRGGRHVEASLPSHTTPQFGPQTASQTKTTADPIESLTSSMSALQFVPRSVYMRGRGRGRGS